MFKLFFSPSPKSNDVCQGRPSTPLLTCHLSALHGDHRRLSFHGLIPSRSYSFPPSSSPGPSFPRPPATLISCLLARDRGPMLLQATGCSCQNATQSMPERGDCYMWVLATGKSCLGTPIYLTGSITPIGISHGLLCPLPLHIRTYTCMHKHIYVTPMAFLISLFVLHPYIYTYTRCARACMHIHIHKHIHTRVLTH